MMTNKEKQTIVNKEVLIFKAKLDIHKINIKISVKELSGRIMEVVK